MKRLSKAVGAGIALLVGSGVALAADLTVEEYVALSLARLTLAEQSWAATNQPPAPDTMTALFSQYGLSEDEYVSYTASNRKAIEAYFAAHPDVSGQVEDLRARIENAINDQPK